MNLVRSSIVWLLLCLAVAVPVLVQAAAEPVRTASSEVGVLAKAPGDTPHSAIPFKQEKQSIDTLAYQSLAALVLVGLAAYGIAIGLKRFGAIKGGPLGNARRVRTVDAIRLGKRSMLYVVEYQGQEILLAESEQGVQLLICSSPETLTTTPAQSSGQGPVNA
ncbi:MAG: flagellar biosynthetic protein FliO [Pseudomonadota bacterium]